MLKRLLAGLCLSLAFATYAVPVDITITFTNATAEETRAATWKLAQVNATRVAHGLEEYASVGAMIIGQIKDSFLPTWIVQEAEAREQEQDVQTLWKNATDAQRAAAIAALQG